MAANHAFHDVIYEAAALPRVEQVAKSARRTFIGTHIWSARSELDELFVRNDMQHRANREALAARNAEGARILARSTSLSSGSCSKPRSTSRRRSRARSDWLAEPVEATDR